MSTAYVVVTLVTAVVLTFSAAADYFLRERVRANMDRVGVPRSWLPTLAALRVAGALGLLAGLALPPVGIAAAAGIVIYFVGAIITHLRARWYDISYPSVYLVLAATSLVLGLAS
jgi:DoxX-like family